MCVLCVCVLWQGGDPCHDCAGMEWGVQTDTLCGRVGTLVMVVRGWSWMVRTDTLCGRVGTLVMAVRGWSWMVRTDTLCGRVGTLVMAVQGWIVQGWRDG